MDVRFLQSLLTLLSRLVLFGGGAAIAATIAIPPWKAAVTPVSSVERIIPPLEIPLGYSTFDTPPRPPIDEINQRYEPLRSSFDRAHRTRTADSGVLPGGGGGLDKNASLADSCTIIVTIDSIRLAWRVIGITLVAAFIAFATRPFAQQNGPTETGPV